MACVCGVDTGSMNTLSYIAWLHDGQFHLDLYLPTIEKPMPHVPAGWEQPCFMSFDAPQGLPALGGTLRAADRNQPGGQELQDPPCPTRARQR
jgi:hypothetical protein